MLCNNPPSITYCENRCDYAKQPPPLSLPPTKLLPSFRSRIQVFSHDPLRGIWTFESFLNIFFVFGPTMGTSKEPSFVLLYEKHKNTVAVVSWSGANLGFSSQQVDDIQLQTQPCTLPSDFENLHHQETKYRCWDHQAYDWLLLKYLSEKLHLSINQVSSQRTLQLHQSISFSLQQHLQL